MILGWGAIPQSHSATLHRQETLGPGRLNSVVRLRETGHCPFYRYLHGARSLGNLMHLLLIIMTMLLMLGSARRGKGVGARHYCR